MMWHLCTYVEALVYPSTTSPWIWPSNGQIWRGHVPNFWILLFMEDFRHVYMTIAPMFPTFDGFFWWLRVWNDVILHECFGLIGWWWHCLHILLDPLDCMVIVFLLLEMFLDGILTFESFGLTTCLQGTSQLVHPSRILPPFRGWLFLTTLIGLFHEDCVLWCLSCHSPSSYEVSSWYLLFWLGFGGCDY